MKKEIYFKPKNNSEIIYNELLNDKIIPVKITCSSLEKSLIPTFYISIENLYYGLISLPKDIYFDNIIYGKITGVITLGSQIEKFIIELEIE